MMKRRTAKILFFTLLAIIGLSVFALSAYFFIKSAKAKYPSDNWLTSEPIAFSKNAKKEPEDFSSFNYDLPLSKYPSNFEDIENEVLGRKMEYDEKVLLLSEGGFTFDPEEEQLFPLLKTLSYKNIPIVINNDLTFADLVIQNRKVENSFAKEVNRVYQDLLTKVLDGTIAFYEKTDDENLKLKLKANALAIFQTLDFLVPNYEVPEILAGDVDISSVSKSEVLKITDNSGLILLSWVVKENDLIDEWNFVYNSSVFTGEGSPIPDLATIDKSILDSGIEINDENVLNVDLDLESSDVQYGVEQDSNCLDEQGLNLGATFSFVYAEEQGGKKSICKSFGDDLLNFAEIDNQVFRDYAGFLNCTDDVCDRNSFQKSALNGFLSAAEFVNSDNVLPSTNNSLLTHSQNIAVENGFAEYFSGVSNSWKNLTLESPYKEFLSSVFTSEVYMFGSQIETLKSINLTSEDKLNKYISDLAIRLDSVETNLKLKVRLMAEMVNGELEIVAIPYFEYQENGITPNYLQTIVNDNNFDEDYDVERTEQLKNSVRVPVLMYHHIDVFEGTGPAKRLYVSPETFEEQIAYLISQNYKILTIDEFYDILKSGKNPTQKSILLTFDDGKRDNYTNAYPILKKYGVPGVFYITTNTTGIKSAELKEMADNGMIIDSHSATHIDLKVEEDEEKLWYEINTSKYILEARTGHTVKSFAYPGCVASQKTFEDVAATGYKVAFSCGSTIDLYFRNRLSLSRMHAYDSMDNFKKILSGHFEIPTAY